MIGTMLGVWQEHIWTIEEAFFAQKDIRNIWSNMQIFDDPKATSGKNINPALCS